MKQTVELIRLTDKDSATLFEKQDHPVLALFESRHDTSIIRMIRAIESILEEKGESFLGAICMAEDCPNLFRQYEVYGVPTLMAIVEGSVHGVSLGIRSKDELQELIEEWIPDPLPKTERHPSEKRNTGNLKYLIQQPNCSSQAV